MTIQYHTLDKFKVGTVCIKEEFSGMVTFSSRVTEKLFDCGIKGYRKVLTTLYNVS